MVVGLGPTRKAAKRRYPVSKWSYA